MLRNIFRTAFIGMMAVAGLFLLFFILKVLLFFLVAGFIARMAMRYFWHKRATEWPHFDQQSVFKQTAEPLFATAYASPYFTGYAPTAPGRQSAIIEITR